MKCARCSAEMPAQSQFCLRCGTPVQTTMLPQGGIPGAQPFAASRPNNRPLLITLAILALAVLGLGAFVVHGMLTQKAGQSGNGQLVQAPGQSNSGALVQAPGDNRGGAPVQAPADTPPSKVVQVPQVNTAEIDDYLKFLKRVEASKQQLLHDEDRDAHTIVDNLEPNLIKEAMRGTDDASVAGDPSVKNLGIPDVTKRMRDIQSNWDQLAAYFQTKKPPQSCVELRNIYLDHLGKVEGRILQIYTILGRIGTDTQGALRDARGMSGPNSDLDADGKAADRALANVCSKYSLSKDFDIKGDESSSGVDSMAGILGQ